MQEFNALLAQPKPKKPLLLSGYLNLAAHLNTIPKKFRSSRRLRTRPRSKSTALKNDGVASLKTSRNILDTIKVLKTRQWTLLDLQHVVVLGFAIFSFLVSPSAPFIKTAVILLYGLLLLMPVTQQFFLPSLPIWVYLYYFFASRFIALEYRPHIWVKVLPALENVLYGANLSNIISAHTHWALDLLAWIPYGLGHFGLPAICTVIMFFFAPPGTTPIFARCFGYMSLVGVTIQLALPTTPPWYEKLHGLEPANYSMGGSPAGLARIDKLLGFDLYTTNFSTAPLPFGAFPSLHSADAVLEALFLGHCFPRYRPFFFVYVGWIWWATMYLNHHYAVDVVAGALLAAASYYFVRAKWLPRIQPDKKLRWEYEYVEYGSQPSQTDEESGYLFGNGYGLGLLERPSLSDSDEWTVGSSSSFDSMSRGELTGSTSSTPGCVSPVTPDDEFRHTIFNIPCHGDGYDSGRPSRESELVDVVVMR